jgi:hypothetical protein
MIRAKNHSGIAPEITPPNYFLQRKLGGPAGRMINPISIKRAEIALEAAMPLVDTEIARLLEALQASIKNKDPQARAHIWRHAHEIRGLAGTVSKNSLGEAADLICRYLHGSPSGFQPDCAVLSTIATVAHLAIKDGADTDAMVEKLLADSARAVDAQRQREGRGLA